MDKLAAEFDKLSRQNPFKALYMVVVEAIHNAISACEFIPGEHLKESDIAERLNVSRATVRRAFDVLLLDGSLIHRAGRGLEVAPMFRHEYLDIIELRAMLDSYSAKLAAAKRTVQDLSDMKRSLVMLFEAEDSEGFIRADVSFHSCIYKASGNPMIIRIYEDFNLDVIRVRYMTAPAIHNMLERVTADHMAIYNAIHRQDPRAAFDEALKHTNILYDPGLISCAFE